MNTKKVPASREFICSSILVLTSTLFLPSCRTKQDPITVDDESKTLVAAETPPFATKEPERYQAVRTITSRVGSATPIISRTMIARAGNKRREEYQTTAGEQLVYLETPRGRFVLLPSKKEFADLEVISAVNGEEQPSTANLSPDLLLNQMPVETRYERLGPEMIGDRKATKYRVLTGSVTRGTAPDTQTLIWIDDVWGMPLRWETIASSDGDETRTTMELTGIDLAVDDSLFELPTDYRRINPREMRRSTDSQTLRRKAEPK